MTRGFNTNRTAGSALSCWLRGMAARSHRIDVALLRGRVHQRLDGV
jgi:hypothetical protein